MNRLKKFLSFMTLCAAVFAVNSVAQAQSRTWVSGLGDDANPCSRTAPCKTFAGAISKTAAGGEIDVLDPGGFGAVTITKAITIDGGTGSGWASVLASLTNGVIVNAGVNDVVTLRNLSINGVGNGINGIRYLAGKKLRVESSHIFGFTTNGIDVNLITNGTLSVVDTSIHDIGSNGIRLTTTSGVVNGSFDRVHVEQCGSGFFTADRVKAVINNSTFTLNSFAALNGSATAASTEVELSSSVISFSGIGILTAGGTVFRLTNNRIGENTTNFSLSGGLIFSFGDNTITGGGVGPNGSPAPTKS